MYVTVKPLHIEFRPTIRSLHHRLICMIGQRTAICSNIFFLTNQNVDM